MPVAHIRSCGLLHDDSWVDERRAPAAAPAARNGIARCAAATGAETGAAAAATTARSGIAHCAATATAEPDTAASTAARPELLPAVSAIATGRDGETASDDTVPARTACAVAEDARSAVAALRGARGSGSRSRDHARGSATTTGNARALTAIAGLRALAPSGAAGPRAPASASAPAGLVGTAGAAGTSTATATGGRATPVSAVPELIHRPSSATGGPVAGGGTATRGDDGGKGDARVGPDRRHHRGAASASAPDGAGHRCTTAASAAEAAGAAVRAARAGTRSGHDHGEHGAGSDRDRCRDDRAGTTMVSASRPACDRHHH